MIGQWPYNSKIHMSCSYLPIPYMENSTLNQFYRYTISAYFINKLSAQQPLFNSKIILYKHIT